MNKTSIVSKIIDTIHDRMRIAFNDSQAKVPVRTGFLKHSGSVTDLDKGSSIVYSAEYSSFVELGLRGGYQNVHGFYRKDGKYVKSFSRYMPYRAGVFFIRNSVQGAMQEFPKFLAEKLGAKEIRRN